MAVQIQEKASFNLRPEWLFTIYLFQVSFETSLSDPQSNTFQAGPFHNYASIHTAARSLSSPAAGRRKEQED